MLLFIYLFFLTFLKVISIPTMGLELNDPKIASCAPPAEPAPCPDALLFTALSPGFLLPALPPNGGSG